MAILSFIYDNYKKTRKKKFTAEEKRILRPIAEVIAIMDGNAFFGLQKDDNGNDTWYEQYLVEAWMIASHKNKINGWVCETSWVKDMTHENPSVEEAYNNWQLLKILSRSNN
jgi:hypothetical protein